ncbi:NAD-dependent epimerase/dehydratase family protein [Albibacterium profundi]|uniref:NAD-dependent epimerase/dehydratase family protein n=1 Tax=Albibacterium profundi TaxID=3134906 RepID=A0ABV5C9P7_9SPHI
MEKSKILFTGSTGFLGTILRSALQEEYLVKDFQDYSNELVDICKPIKIDIDFQPDMVIHAAGKAHSVPRTDKEKQLFYDVNYQGTVNVTKYIDNLPHKPSSLIFISTVAVYGLDKGENIIEDHPLNGDTPYAKSKIMAEQYLAEWANKNDIVLGVLRLPLVAGPNPPGNLGAMINGIKTGKYLSIGKADAKKSIIWAADIADIVPKLAEVGGTYNITDGYNPSFGELEKEISKSLNKSNPITIPMFLAKILGGIGDLLGSKAPVNSDKIDKITSTLTFNDDKIRNSLGWNPSKVLGKIKEIV